MDAEGQFATYSFAKNVRINDEDGTDENRTVTNDQIKTDVALDYTGGSARTFMPTTQQVVMYTVNGSGVLSELYWGNGINWRDDRYALAQTSGTRAQYKENTARLGSVVIPEDMTFATLEGTTYQDMDPLNNDLKQSEFAITSAAVLDEDNDTGYLYDIVYNRESKTAVFGILFDCKAKTAGDSAVMLVTAVGDTTDADGASAKKVTGWVDGVKASFVVSDDVYYYDVNNALAGSQSTYAGYIAKGALIQYVGTDVASAIRVLVTPDQMLKTAQNVSGKLSGSVVYDSNASDYTTEMNDKLGALYVGKLAEYKSGSADFVGGTNLSVPSITATTLLRFTLDDSTPPAIDGIGNIYGGELMAFGVAESNTNKYVDNNNEDYVIVYSFDGDAKAAVILDTDNDDIWN